MVFSIIMLVCLIVCVGIDYLSLKRIERNATSPCLKTRTRASIARAIESTFI